MPIFIRAKRELKDPSDVTCCLCRVQVAAIDSSTTNLYLHLKVHHPQEYTGLRAAAPAFISDSELKPGVKEHQPSNIGDLAKTLKVT